MNVFRKIIFIRPMPWLLVMLAIFILAGCATVGPDYVPPDTPVSPAWHTQLKGGR